MRRRRMNEDNDCQPRVGMSRKADRDSGHFVHWN